MGRVYTVGGGDDEFMVAHLFGSTPFEWGVAHGTLLKDEINSLIPSLLIHFEVGGSAGDRENARDTGPAACHRGSLRSCSAPKRCVCVHAGARVPPAGTYVRVCVCSAVVVVVGCHGAI